MLEIGFGFIIKNIFLYSVRTKFYFQHHTLQSGNYYGATNKIIRYFYVFSAYKSIYTRTYKYVYLYSKRVICMCLCVKIIFLYISTAKMINSIETHFLQLIFEPIICYFLLLKTILLNLTPHIL